MSPDVSGAEATRRWLPRMRESGWLLPLTLATDDVVPTGTRIGVVDGDVSATVDARGLVTPSGSPTGWSLDWWVGAEDRWRLPARETGVSQRRIDAAPVVETTVRVPGGEVVHRAYEARGPAHPGGDAWTVVEVENRSPVPVALAWAFRPLDPRGVRPSAPPSVRPVAPAAPNGPHLVESPDLVAVLLRPPSRWARGSTGVDVVHEVTAGAAAAGPVAPPPDDPDDGGDLASLALLTPLPHTATARIVIARRPVVAGPEGSATVRGEPRPIAWPDALPPAEAVARGWSVLAARGPRLELPDPVLADAVAAARRALPLCHRVRRERAATDREPPPATHTITAGDGWRPTDAVADRMEMLAALSWWGDAEASDRALVDWPRAQQRGGGFGDPAATALALMALAAHAVASGDVGPAVAWLPELGGATEALGRAARRRRAHDVDPRLVARGLDAAAVLLAGLGQANAAARIAAHADAVLAAAGPLPQERPAGGGRRADTPRALAAAAVATTRAGDPSPDLWALLRRASPTWTWADPERWVGDDGLVSARLLTAVGQLFVDDRPDRLGLVPWMPPEWWGRGWEIHSAPTRWGHLSYAVRWHSGRPAVLWELGDPLDGVTAEPVLTAPGLDPTWRATGRTGEALLGPVRPPAELDVGDGPERTGGVAVAAPPRSVWRPEDPGPDAPPRPGPGRARPEVADDPSAAPESDGPPTAPPDGGSFS